jgi:hypothetical protein
MTEKQFGYLLCAIMLCGMYLHVYFGDLFWPPVGAALSKTIVFLSFLPSGLGWGLGLYFAGIGIARALEARR